MTVKRFLVVIGMVLLFSAVTSYAQEARHRVGVHGAYSKGGDIDECEFGFGAQAELAINPNFSVELAVSRFSEEDRDDEFLFETDFTTIGVSVVCRVPLSAYVYGYLLAGGNYNIIDNDARYLGTDIDMDVDLDDEIGFHAGAGVNVHVQDSWELFAEYRYTFLDLEGDMSVGPVEVEIEGSYDFGLIKVGVNYLF